MFLIRSKKDVKEFISNFSAKFATDAWGEGWDAFFYSTYNGNNVLIQKDDGLFYDFWYNQNSYDREPSEITDIADYVWENRKFINNILREKAKEHRKIERIYTNSR